VTREPAVWAALAIATAVLIGLLFQFSPLLALGACTALVLASVALRWPDVATYAVLFLLYSNLPVVGVNFHGIPKVMAAAYLLLLVVPFVDRVLTRRQGLVVTPVLWLLALFLGAQIVAMAFSRDPGQSLRDVLTYALEGVGLYFLVTNVVRDRETLRGATWALLAAGALMSVAPLIQQATGTFERDYGGLAQVDGAGFRTGHASEESSVEERQSRLAGPIGEKNRFAQILLILLPLGLSRVWEEKRRALRLVALGCTTLIALGFVLAFSRGGALGLACMLAVMLVLRLIDIRRAVCVGAGLVLLLLAVPQYWKRIATMTSAVRLVDETAQTSEPDGAVRRRVTEMLAALRVFLDHPVVGVGPGLFKDYAEEYGNIDALRRIEGPRRAHSLYLEIAAETGTIGLCLFLAVLLVTIAGLVAARRAYLVNDPELAGPAAAYLLALVGYLSTGIFLHLAFQRYFYLLLALGGAMAHVAYARRKADVELAAVCA
jgi:hypothetical protein